MIKESITLQNRNIFIKHFEWSKLKYDNIRLMSKCVDNALQSMRIYCVFKDFVCDEFRCLDESSFDRRDFVSDWRTWSSNWDSKSLKLSWKRKKNIVKTSHKLILFSREWKWWCIVRCFKIFHFLWNLNRSLETFWWFDWLFLNDVKIIDVEIIFKFVLFKDSH